MTPPVLNDDFKDFLSACLAEEVRFLLVGAYALAVHGIPRATGDIDVWIEASPENAERTWRALERFGAPVAALGVSQNDLTTPDVVVQLGLPPRRIDLLTGISGVAFAEAWESRITAPIDGLLVPVLSRDLMQRNKRSSARPKDRLDADLLEG